MKIIAPLFTVLLLLCFIQANAQLGIGTATPEASAVLDVSSTSKGFLPPRMIEAHRNAIVNPEIGLQVYCIDCGYNGGELQFYNGTTWVNIIGGVAKVSIWPANYVHCDPTNPTRFVEVTSVNGKIWMDRNLGASQAATSSTDVLSYGDLYQWGRRADGHQCRNSSTTTTTSSIDVPAHGDFIYTPNTYTDWRDPHNGDLWQGVNGVNNPCPIGFRLPTNTELENEKANWNTQNSSGAYASALKLPLAGYRYYQSGTVDGLGQNVYYWSSAYSNFHNKPIRLFVEPGSTSTNFGIQAWGCSVRCIKN